MEPVSFANHPSPNASLRSARARGMVAAVLFAATAWQLVACGGAEPRASVTNDAPATLEGAEAELARLEASLETSFGVKDTGDAPSEPAPPPTAGMAQPLSKKNESANRCENACDALASMGRSAERICQLAGPGERCDTAKSRVASATTRVTAQCSECES
jgi:hypothetical protein